MNPVMIRIMAVVGIIIGFVFMGLLYGYNEQLYASLSDHCNINSERVITLRLPANTSTNFNLTSGTSSSCTFARYFEQSATRGDVDDSDAAAVTARATALRKEATDDMNDRLPGINLTQPTSEPATQVVNFETPNGTTVPITFYYGFSTGDSLAAGDAENVAQVAWSTNTVSTSTSTAASSLSSGTDHQWETAPGLGGQFRTLTFLLIAVIPLALVAAVIAQAVPLIMSGGSSSVTDIVNKQTMGLLIAAAVIIAAPILFEQAGNSKNDLVGLGSAAQFLTITNLIFDLVPLVYTIGVMGLIIYGSGLVQRFGGGKGMSGVGMRMGM